MDRNKHELNNKWDVDRMKKLIIPIMTIFLMAIAFAQTTPYAIYGKANSGAEVKVIAYDLSNSDRSTIADSEGNYLIDLDSQYSQITIQSGRCTKEVVLTSGPNMNIDIPCNSPIGPIVGGLAALSAGAGAYYLKKKNAKNKAKKRS